MLSLVLAAAPLTLPTVEVYWVDPAHGSNSASGTSANDAFRTLSHALGRTVDGDTVRVLPGVLNQANGELFPITFWHGVTVESTGGPDVTRIEGPAGLVAFRAQTESRVAGFTLTSDTTVTYSNLVLGQYNPPGGPARLEDCRVLNPTGDGIYGRDLVMKDCEVRVGDLALQGQFETVRAEDCRFLTDGDTYAVHLYWGQLRLERCDVSAPAGVGVLGWTALEYGTGGINIRNSVVHDCSGSAIEVQTSGDRHMDLTIEGSTIAGGGTRGVFITTYGDSTVTGTLRSSIVAGHGIADTNGSLVAEASLVGDGSLSGPGVISGDPRFVDAAGGDLRLRFDSPCKDAAALPGSPFDVTGSRRDVDGDLDLVPAPDMGAFEHRTLVAPRAAPLGEPIRIGMTGSDGGFSFAVMDVRGFAANTLSTPYGTLRVHGPSARRFAPVVTTGAGPTYLTIPPLFDPALSGATVAFQALTRSTNAPAQAAFSNPHGVLID